MHETEILLNFGIDLVAVLLLTGALYFPRHKRRDLFVTFTFFNIAMFIIVTLITRTPLSVGASFGLFALLAIIRLRSEEFSNYEIGYFFGCLTLAIINGLGHKNYDLTLSMDAAILLSMYVLDHPLIFKDVQHSKVRLDIVYNDDSKLKEALEKLLHAKILAFRVTTIDNVQDTTNVRVDYQKLKKDVKKRSKKNG